MIYMCYTLPVFWVVFRLACMCACVYLWVCACVCACVYMCAFMYVCVWDSVSVCRPTG